MIRWLAIALLLPALCWGQDELNSESGLVGRWLVPGWQTGNGAVPTRVLDLSISNMQGTSSNGSTYKIISGMPALKLNGTNQYINIQNKLPSLLKTSNFTVCAWIYPTSNIVASANILSSVVQNKDPSGDNSSDGFMLGISTYVQSGAFFRVASNANDINAPKQITPLVWQHLCGVKNATNTILYKNGKKITTAALTVTTNMYNGDNIRIGFTSGPVVSKQWDGGVCDVRIYNRALSASEIKSIYEQGLAPK